jgi:hypothetical protein
MYVNREFSIREIVVYVILATFLTGCGSSTQPSRSLNEPNGSSQSLSPTHVLHVTTSATACHSGAPYYVPQFVLETDYPMHVVARPSPVGNAVSYTLPRNFTGGVPQFTDGADTGDVTLVVTITGDSVTGALQGSGFVATPGYSRLLVSFFADSPQLRPQIPMTVTGVMVASGMRGTLSGTVAASVFGLNNAGGCTAPDHSWTLARIQ